MATSVPRLTKSLLMSRTRQASSRLLDSGTFEGNMMFLTQEGGGMQRRLSVVETSGPRSVGNVAALAQAGASVDAHMTRTTNRTGQLARHTSADAAAAPSQVLAGGGNHEIGAEGHCVEDTFGSGVLMASKNSRGHEIERQVHESAGRSSLGLMTSSNAVRMTGAEAAAASRHMIGIPALESKEEEADLGGDNDAFSPHEWREVTIKPFTDPITGDPALLVSETDATERVRTEAGLSGLNEVSTWDGRQSLKCEHSKKTDRIDNGTCAF